LIQDVAHPSVYSLGYQQRSVYSGSYATELAHPSSPPVPSLVLSASPFFACVVSFSVLKLRDHLKGVVLVFCNVFCVCFAFVGVGMGVGEEGEQRR